LVLLMRASMAIERGYGNLLQADVDALVNTVNAEGVMGKGIALQFKKAFPDNFRSYERDCKAGEVAPGRMHVVRRIASPRFIINFPTKKHWRHPSKIEYVRDGLRDLVAKVRELGIRSIAIPPLGCGNGGLDWSDVSPLIVQAFASLPDVRVVLFEPSGAPSADEIIDRRAKPEMTEARATVLALMGQYLETGYDYRLSLLEVQKLAYFLQEAGQGLRLAYRAYYYGPYADDLRKALRNIEGHYTRGLGDGKNSPETPLEPLPNAVSEARAFLGQHPEACARLERVGQLIEGFETPLGMELLGTVHWVMKHEANPDDADKVVAKVHGWSERKRSQMKDGQIRAAWERLREQGWAGGAQGPAEAIS
jgi:O-acetyl-ADP-ribose deacetylase (regulator of RNase III)